MNIFKIQAYIVFAFAAAVLAQTTNVNLTPQQIPGIAKADVNKPSAGYGDSTVQTQLRVDVKESEKAIRFIRTNTDPYVLTKLYTLKHAEPYALRGYLLGVVKGTSNSANTVQVDAIRYNDGRGVLLVSAEDYRFQKNGKGDSIDEIIERLDQPGIGLSSGRPKYIYFPKVNAASNLKEMVANVGATANDVEFTNGVDKLVVDGGLNALFIGAPHWSLKHILEQLAEYDRPMPEIHLNYQLIEVTTDNEDKLGVDFQSWKNKEGAAAFAAGGRYRNNWSHALSGGIDGSRNNRTDFFNFNPKWSTEYLDFLAANGHAKVVTSGVVVAKNRRQAKIRVASGVFYEAETAIAPSKLNQKIIDGRDKLPDGANLELKHGNEQVTKAANGFLFELDVTPVVTGKASILPLKVTGTSLLGWNGDGSPRLNTSNFETEVHVGHEGKDFVVGGIQRSDVVCSQAGVPLLKSIPYFGKFFSTESEATRHSELLLIARVEYSNPFDNVSDKIRADIQDVVEK